MCVRFLLIAMLMCLPNAVGYAQAVETVLVVGQNGVKLPLRTKNVDPVVPSGIEPRGIVYLQLVISPKGLVEKVAVIRGVRPPEPELDKAAIEAAKKWEYRPTVIGGVAYPVRFNSVITFKPQPSK